MVSGSMISDEDSRPLRARALGTDQLAGRRVLIKYGGNAMTDARLVDSVLTSIIELQQAGVRLVLVHGGGPYIQQLLDSLGLESEFVDGHRRTDAAAMRVVSMVLSGRVNGEIVARLNQLGARAVGICGRDAGMARVVPRRIAGDPTGNDSAVDLGFVGDIEHINPRVVLDLLELGYLPVVAPVSTGPDGNDYNVNADMFAGHLAAALQVHDYLVLTDVDGLYRDQTDPNSLISLLTPGETEHLLGKTIAGGMIPKVQSCTVAVAGGVSAARIVNGTKPESLWTALVDGGTGTTIKDG